MKRNIISIDEKLCNGCGACVNGCHEGALQLIDGKARIVSELYCDGLGACIGDCPVGAIKIEEKEAEAYDEIAVMERISPKGEQTILAHIKHLKDHGEKGYVHQAIDYIKEKGLKVDLSSIVTLEPLACGSPGSMARSIERPLTSASELTQWPVQLHLVNPQASYFTKSDILIAADCTAYAYARFHQDFIKNHKVVIACPKLDTNKDSYIDKITQLIDDSKANTITVAIMEVPCCGGLIQLTKIALEKASRKVPVKKVVISTSGEILSEEWI